MLFVGDGTATLTNATILLYAAIGGTGSTTGQGIGGSVTILPAAIATADKATVIKFNFASTAGDDAYGTLST